MRSLSVVACLMTLGFLSVVACSGKSESSDENDGEAGAGGSNAGGGSAGSSTGGTSGASGASGTSGASGASGVGGGPFCMTPIGVLCVRGTPDGENERLDVGDPLRIEVRPSGCFSSSCTEATVAECSVTGSGPELTAAAEFCLTVNADPNVGCTADCGGGGFAFCESDEGLEAGDYTVTLGDLSVSFTVPGNLSFAGACDGSQF